MQGRGIIEGMWIRWRHVYREGPGDWAWLARDAVGQRGVVRVAAHRRGACSVKIKITSRWDAGQVLYETDAETLRDAVVAGSSTSA